MPKKLKQIFAFLAIIVGSIVFVATLANGLLYAPEESDFLSPTTTLASHAATSTTPGNIPMRLRIPSLNIDANVQSVGLGKTGNMAVPTNYTDVAWYRGGAQPGTLGSAVFDGHVDNGFGLDGVLKHLGEITPGQKILTTSKEGETYTYIVERIGNYPLHDVPREEIFNTPDKSQLVLITCEGAWISGEKTYDHRLVVYATLEA